MSHEPEDGDRLVRRDERHMWIGIAIVAFGAVITVAAGIAFSIIRNDCVGMNAQACRSIHPWIGYLHSGSQTRP